MTKTRRKTLRRNFSGMNALISHTKSLSTFDFAKWLGIVSSIFATFFFTAGVAYRVGYWDRTGIDVSLIQIATMDLAFLGFITSIYSLLYVLGLIALWGLGIYGVEHFTNKKIHLNDIFQKPSLSLGSLLACIIAFCVLVLTFFTLYIVMSRGWSDMNNEICRAQKAENFPTSIYLENGKIIQGRILARSEKLTVLITKDQIVTPPENGKARNSSIVTMKVLTVGEKPRLLDSTHLSCKLN